MGSKISNEMEPPAMQNVQDLKLIKGIGPKVEKHLNAAGVFSYSQLANKTSDELASALNDLAGFSAERIDELDWINEAQKLSAKYQLPETETSSESRQHYAVFTVELLLDEENNVRRTRAMHVQSQVESTWAGWEQTRLANFFSESAELNLPSVSGISYNETPVVGDVKSEAVPVEEPQVSTPIPLTPAKPKVTQAAPEITGELHLEDLLLRSEGNVVSQSVINSSRPFYAQLQLDLSNVDIPKDNPLKYSVSIYAKELSAGPRRVVGYTEGNVLPAKQLTIDVKNIRLSQGTYRIEAIAKLFPAETNGKKTPGLMAATEGSLVHVY